MLALPPPFVELLRHADPHPFRPGALRPDFLLDADGVPRVCEVNARFPTNGFLCSYYTNQVVEGLDHLAGGRPGPFRACAARSMRWPPRSSPARWSSS